MKQLTIINYKARTIRVRDKHIKAEFVTSWGYAGPVVEQGEMGTIDIMIKAGYSGFWKECCLFGVYIKIDDDFNENVMNYAEKTLLEEISGSLERGLEELLDDIIGDMHEQDD